MKIVILPDAYYPDEGGAQYLSKNLAEAFVKKNHDVYIILSDKPSYNYFSDKKTQSGESVVNGVHILRLPYGGWVYDLGRLASKAKKPYRILRFIRIKLIWLIQQVFSFTLNKTISKIQPDILMALPHGYYNVKIAMHYSEKYKIPFVAVPLIPSLLLDQRMQLEIRRVITAADAVIACTPSEQKKIVENYYAPPKKVFVTGVGMHVRESKITQGNSETVLFIGRKTAYKGIANLIQAMKIEWDKNPRVNLVVAGHGKIEENLILGLDKIIELPKISEEAKEKLLSEASCLVLPSRGEAFGIVLLEAWAHGRPVIALDLPVFKDIIEHEEDGLLVPPDDIEGLAQAIHRLISDPNLAFRMGAAGHKKVKEKYNWDIVSKHFLEAVDYAAKSRK